ncbi:putative pre-16S rRNA nuclease [Aureimonas endophytica]|uniref:Putative pre-16S rRNA nuclease n=1 Tax=Aureimonas endophytica TaxID=2027858 RepID=A0A916ZCQ9_9HYPH|nr:Holliday junction resolvase RuvX [Aureimonas endophytica]GGD88365.1 putative pre-16S rRNA nuclease [Aureimonas endophytica]
MPIVDVTELASLRDARVCLAGLDLGTKTIGVALSDLSWAFGQPRSVIRRTKFTADATALKALLDDTQAGGIVIGLPLNMDGTEGPRVQSTRAFVRNYLKFDDRQIAFWDERLSTVAATRAMISMDVSRAKRAERVDAAAAAFILQGALDRLASL